MDEEQKRKRVRDEWLAARFKRFLLAFYAVVALIAPMLLMSLVKTLTCSLATTSIATMLFAILITFIKAVNEGQIFGITAAYAAVLVVFVGTQH